MPAIDGSLDNHICGGYHSEAIERLLGSGWAALPVIILAAHPDDEVLGAGGLLKYLKDVRIIHITDGAPKKMKPGSLGFNSSKEYSLARRAELASALRLLPGGNFETIEMGIPDLEATFNLPFIARESAALFKKIRPAVVFTHPYEGGHPDHDSAAFAARAAIKLLEEEGAGAPGLLEFTSYHSRAGRMVTSEFLPGRDSVKFILSEGERLLKKEMIEAFITQRGALKVFSTDYERFRRAPFYDFNSPPHEGKLFYENFKWGVSGKLWRRRASRALKELKLNKLTIKKTDRLNASPVQKSVSNAFDFLLAAIERIFL